MNEYTQKLTELDYKTFQSGGGIFVMIFCTLVYYLFNNPVIEIIAIFIGVSMFFYCFLLWIGAMNWRVRRDVKIFNERVDKYRREHGLDNR